MKKYTPVLMLLLFSCQQESTSVDCAASGLNLEIVETSAATCGQSDGSILLAATGGVGPYTFNIGGTNFSESGDFNGLRQGIYDVGVTDANNCAISRRGIAIDPEGVVSFSESIAPILSSNCTLAGCHVPEPGTSRQDLTNFTIVQQLAKEIKARTQNGEMPKTGSISQSQIDLIACWVDGGALDN